MIDQEDKELCRDDRSPLLVNYMNRSTLKRSEQSFLTSITAHRVTIKVATSESFALLALGMRCVFFFYAANVIQILCFRDFLLSLKISIHPRWFAAYFSSGNEALITFTRCPWNSAYQTCTPGVRLSFKISSRRYFLTAIWYFELVERRESTDTISRLKIIYVHRQKDVLRYTWKLDRLRKYKRWACVFVFYRMVSSSAFALSVIISVACVPFPFGISASLIIPNVRLILIFP